jgi:hypothetical protein
VAERPARDLDAAHEHAVGVVAERRVEAAETGEAVGIEEALGGKDRVVGGGPMALGEQEAVAIGVVGVSRIDPQHAVVENPEHVERRERAPVVLLVAGEPRQ